MASIIEEVDGTAFVEGGRNDTASHCNNPPLIVVVEILDLLRQ
jgi:hypothetical protein